MFRPGRILVALVFFFPSLSGGQTLVVGKPEIVLAPADTIRSRILGWPDGNLTAFLENGTYYIFSSNAYLGATQGLTSSNLNNLRADHRVIKSKPLPKGGRDAFDRDYAGGGAVYYDAPSGTLLQLYHGEFFYGGGPVAWLPAYTSLGLAYSKDRGKSWKKLGEVLTANAPRANRCPIDIGNGSLVYRPDGYLYAYYSDSLAPCQDSMIAVARAKLSDLIAAANSGKFPGGSGSVFLKYNNGTFSEPGVRDPAHPAEGGGAFTPMFTYSGDENGPTMSSVAFASVIDAYVMTYIAGWHQNGSSGTAIRLSRDGLHWSDPTLLQLGRSPFYPSLLDASGGDPEKLSSHFYLYYVDPFPGPENQNLMRIPISVEAN